MQSSSAIYRLTFSSKWTSHLSDTVAMAQPTGGWPSLVRMCIVADDDSVCIKSVCLASMAAKSWSEHLMYTANKIQIHMGKGSSLCQNS